MVKTQMERSTIFAALFSFIVMSSGCSTSKTVPCGAYASTFLDVALWTKGGGTVALDSLGKGGDSSLIIFTPGFREIDLVCGKMPDYQKDTDILLCCEAAFTGELLEEFSHDNIAGNHVSSGVFHEGYECPDNTGFFVYDGKAWSFALSGRIPQDKPLRAGFSQNMIISEGQVQPRFRDRLPDGRYYFRALCSLEGMLCVVESAKEIRYAEFVDLLSSAGVDNALYMDMGSGWNYSWFRRKAGQDVTIIHPWIEKCKYTTNWIVFR